MSLSPEEMNTLLENGFLVVRSLISDDWLAQVQREAEGLHDAMAEHTPEGVHVSWEEFDDPAKPKRIRQLMHAELVSEGLSALLVQERLAPMHPAVPETQETTVERITKKLS